MSYPAPPSPGFGGMRPTSPGASSPSAAMASFSSGLRAGGANGSRSPSASRSPNSSGVESATMMQHDLSDVRSQVSLLQIRLQKANEANRGLQDENQFFRDRYALIKQELGSVQRNTLQLQQQLTASSLALEDSQTKLSQAEVLNLMLEDKLNKALNAYDALNAELKAAKDRLANCANCSTLSPIPHRDLAALNQLPPEPMSPLHESQSRVQAIVSRFSTTFGQDPASFTLACQASNAVATTTANSSGLPDSGHASPSPSARRSSLPLTAAPSHVSGTETSSSVRANVAGGNNSTTTPAANTPAQISSLPHMNNGALSSPTANSQAGGSPRPVPRSLEGDTSANDNRATMATFVSSAKDSAYFSRMTGYSTATVDSMDEHPTADTTDSQNANGEETQPTDGNPTTLRSTVDFLALSMEEQFLALQNELSGFTPTKPSKVGPRQSIHELAANRSAAPGQQQPVPAPAKPSPTAVQTPNAKLDARRLREDSVRQSFDILKALGSLQHQLDMIAASASNTDSGRVIAPASGSVVRPTSPALSHITGAASATGGIPMRSSSRGPGSPHMGPVSLPQALPPMSGAGTGTGSIIQTHRRRSSLGQVMYLNDADRVRESMGPATPMSATFSDAGHQPSHLSRSGSNGSAHSGRPPVPPLPKDNSGFLDVGSTMTKGSVSDASSIMSHESNDEEKKRKKKEKKEKEVKKIGVAAHMATPFAYTPFMH
ncbi:hypothetical protein BCR44DRAFT_1148583 [Catenaria anguillulae PL171]|uniref:Uncharacterized protein n=1 Tax=Catenaria anguillulae PL171 TaxID=765915 RepID=A0A1Y2HLN0_9FUNG|nr:hypothetical protein BCR44DRAFT_1148583 [Catenaria anguillulae PL171]